MANSSDAESRAFAEARRALLDALDRTQQEAYEQANELVRRGERRAHEIIVESDQCAALIEEQLTYLTEQIEHVRVKVLEIRARLAREAKPENRSMLAAPLPASETRRPAPAPRNTGLDARNAGVDALNVGLDARVQPPEHALAPPVAPPVTLQSPGVPDADAQWRRPGVPAVSQSPVPVTAPDVLDPDSLHETLRTLRSALESLDNQSSRRPG